MPTSITPWDDLPAGLDAEVVAVNRREEHVVVHATEKDWRVKLHLNDFGYLEVTDSGYVPHGKKAVLRDWFNDNKDELFS